MLYNTIDSNDESSFDEDDEVFMEETSDSVTSVVPEIFPSTIPIVLVEEHCKLHYAPIHRLPKDILIKCLLLIESNLKAFYIKHQGLRWKLDKLKEMQETGLIYVWYTDSNDKLIGFISFMLSYSDQYKVLYLYEIHVATEYQSKKIGSQLIDKLHEFSHHLKIIASKKHEYRHFVNSGTSLTVFSDNKALQWYQKLGYQLTVDSPRDKVLRNKVVKPEYYLLIRFNDSLPKAGT